MRKIAATYLFPVTSPPIKYGIVSLDDNNVIVDIKDNGGAMIEEEGCEYYSGVLIPGLVNAHTHLELSHLKNYVDPHRGMSAFLDKMISRPVFDTISVQKAIEFFDQKMYAQGVSLVGDICNGNSTINVKSTSKIHYHSFVELMGLNSADVQKRFQHGEALFNEFTLAHLPVSLSPHAPYSVHHDLMSEIALHGESDILSVHMLENRAQHEMLSNDTDSLMHFFSDKGILREKYLQLKHPMEFILNPLNSKQMLLVHNLYTTPKDWAVALQLAKRNALSLFAVTCPRSNAHIHTALPDYATWPAEIPVCIGTDSLASNSDLSVFNEILYLSSKTNFSFDTLLSWATINGAMALKMEGDFGSIEMGKSPGLNLVSGFNYSDMKLSDNSTIQRLV